jgi:membrane-associated phospholipid phosphatase
MASASLLATCFGSGSARADDAAPSDDDAADRVPFARPPGQPVPVPNPSPVVVGGAPIADGRVAAPLEWQRRRFDGVDAAIMFTGGAITVATAIIPPSPHHLRGPILFDEAARSTLRASSTETRFVFRDASDVGLSLAVTWPFFIDALFTAWWYRGSRDVAEEMALVGLETMAVSGAIQGVTNTIVSRERPYGADCRDGKLPPEAIDCTSSSHFRSFFSGHSAFSFTGAALVCFNHFELGLLGAPGDALSCAGAYAVAATTATFRVVGDMHYASDVLTGALLGTVVGYGVPLLHFRRGARAERANGPSFRIVPSAGGAGIVGLF